MKILPMLRTSLKTRKIDKYHLTALLSRIPTKTNDGNFLITRLKTTNGSLTDMRSSGGGASIKIGKATLDTDLNGNITGYKKPFYKSLNKLVRKATNFIGELSVNFTNKDVVQRNTVEMVTFSKEKLSRL